jgi:predicted signal transduction protein with EAL and GGDEF domain
MGEQGGSVLSNAVTTAVHNAIAGSDNMIMYYQPIQNLETGQVEYYEALVRIREQGKVIPPSGDFPGGRGVAAWSLSSTMRSLQPY